jgi:hypothetical protein
MSVLRVRELTARGRGAIRVLELTGPDALARLVPLLGGRRIEPGTFAPVELCDQGGQVLDEALVLVESSSRLELHLHASQPLIERVRAALGDVEEGPVVLSLEERAERKLERAASESGARILLAQAEGALRAELGRLLLVGEEERVEGARALAQRGRRARWLLDVPRVVLAGPVNAGKSTLFNLLVGRERVVVSAEPGTTRDVVHARTPIGELVVELLDTAGEREVTAEDEEARLEREGQALARYWRVRADLVLWLSRSGQSVPAPEAERVRVLHTFADLDPAASSDPTSLSARCEPEAARETVARAVRDGLGIVGESLRPGAPVPFEPELTELLARVEGDALRLALTRWLAPRAVQPD